VHLIFTEITSVSQLNYRHHTLKAAQKVMKDRDRYALHILQGVNFVT